MSVFKSNFFPLLKLILPLVLIGVVQSSVYFFETVFLAHAGSEVLEAGALVTWLLSTIDSIIFGILGALNVLVAWKFGKKNISGIAMVLRDGLWVSLLLALPVMIIFWNIAPLFGWFGLSPKVVELSKQYLHALSFGIIADFIRIAILEFLVGIGNTRIIIVFSALTVSCNILLSYALIFGKWYFPALGIAGAGWGISISNWVELILLIIYLACRRDYRVYFQYLFSFASKSYVLDIIRIGLPMGGMYCIEVAFFFVLTIIMGSQGAGYLVANQIAMQYIATLMAVIFSMAQGVTVRMGHLLGAGNGVAARQSVYAGVLLSSAVTVLAGLVYCMFPAALIALDFEVTKPENMEIVTIATEFLFIGALFQLIEGVRLTLFGALRALKDTKFTLVISTLCLWGVALPIGYLFAVHLHVEGSGYWWGMFIGTLLSVFLLYARFRKKMPVSRETDCDENINCLLSN